MSKLIILSGPPASGKTTFAKKWVAERPARRARVENIPDALSLLRDGFDVVLDADEKERAAAIRRLWGRPNTEVKKFTRTYTKEEREQNR